MSMMDMGVDLGAQAVDANGDPVSGVTLNYCSDSQAVATVADGQVQATGSAGTANITICVGSVSTTVEVTVSSGEIPGRYDAMTSSPMAGRYGAVAFVINNVAYVGTGSTQSETYTKDFYKYDPETDTWAEISSLPGLARSNAVAFVIDGKGYVGLGASASASTPSLVDFYAYDPAEDSWEAVEDYGGYSRYSATAFVVDGKAYVGTGSNSGRKLFWMDDIWEYNPAIDYWRPKNDFEGDGRHSAIGFTIGNFGYLGLGNGAGPDGNGTDYFSDIWRYDPSDDSWTQITPFRGAGRQDPVVFVKSNRAYVGLGASPVGTYTDFYAYDVEGGYWLDKQDFPDARHSGIAFTIGSYGYIGFGTDNNNASYHNDVYRFWDGL
jgi:N-acetylneuraminic acid mutarotase